MRARDLLLLGLCWPVCGGLMVLTASSPPQLPPAVAHSVATVLQEKMSRHRIPGLSAAIVRDGQLVWSGGFGLADVEGRVPATAATVYRTASIGKTITATAVMRLAQDGRIDLDAPIQRYCPAFPEKRWTVTTRHLLGHTSGIRHYGGPRNDQELHNTVRYTDVVTPLDIFKNDPLRFQPGSQHLYSTFGYSVLGCVIEGATGRTYLDHVRDQVFAPAGMRHTRDDDSKAEIPERAQGYRMVEGRLALARKVDMSSKIPAGGFVTTAEDLARFAVAVMDHRLVSRETLEQMPTPVRLSSGATAPMGLGWGLFPGERWLGHREAFHGGITPGVSGVLYLLPDARFAVVVLMNLQDVPERTALAASLAKVALSK